MKGIPAELSQGTRADEALPVEEVQCNHPSWNLLNKKIGCIHREHGPYPFTKADLHSGLRMVRGTPTRFIPKGDG